MKNSCVILPCCLCQERLISLSLSLSLLVLSPTLPPLPVILIICPSKLCYLSPLLIASCFNTPLTHSVPSSISPLCFCSFSYSQTAPPHPDSGSSQLSGRGYLGLRIRKTQS